MIEKHVVTDEDGNPTELRYYEDGKLTARLQIVLDSDGNFVSLRELPTETVSPESWLKKLGLKKPKEKRISINTIDFIGLINWINTIKTIKTINTIENVDLIKEITNLKKVDEINLIDQIHEINLIEQIHEIDYTGIETQLLRNPYFHLASKYWNYNIHHPPTFSNGLCVLKKKIGPSLCYVTQFVPRYYASSVDVVFDAECLSGTATVILYLHFTDRTSEQVNFNVSSRDFFNYRSTSKTKFLNYIYLVNLSEDYDVNLYMFKAVVVNASVNIEREDLITKSWDLTAGTTSLLSAVSGKRHKVYGWDYEADTDGANEFSATIGGVTVKFGRRVTKGVHAMSLVHPIICDVNTALSFISAGSTKLSLRYVTEV